jgi:glycine cleavage system aminomethyltransferase T
MSMTTTNIKHYSFARPSVQLGACASATEVGPSTDVCGRVRPGVTLSDQNNYSKFLVSGRDAVTYLNQLNVVDVSRLSHGRATTSFMLSDTGIAICDLYILSLGDGFLLLTEGRSTEETLDYLNSHRREHCVSIQDRSEAISLLGIDGPCARELLGVSLDAKLPVLRYLDVAENQALGETRAHVMRAGKPGELGYLLITEKGTASQLWATLLASINQAHEVWTKRHKTTDGTTISQAVNDLENGDKITSNSTR